MPGLQESFSTPQQRQKHVRTVPKTWGLQGAQAVYQLFVGAQCMCANALRSWVHTYAWAQTRTQAEATKCVDLCIEQSLRNASAPSSSCLGGYLGAGQCRVAPHPQPTDLQQL